MDEAYFGIKELYEVVLKANSKMNFGLREIEKGEPVLYFEKISMALLSEKNRPIIARGGWGNTPFVIWEDRSELTFSLMEGVMSSLSMGLLFGAKVAIQGKREDLYLPKKEGPFYLDDKKKTHPLSREPALNKKMFCYEYANDVIQRKVNFQLDGKTLTIPEGEIYKEYLFDYYFKYGDDALIYNVAKERFTGTFTLEAKFYSKDEIDGINTTNVIFMPKVRVVSDINLRLGERADPTTSVFNIIAMPEKTDNSREMIMKIVRLNEDID